VNNQQMQKDYLKAKNRFSTEILKVLVEDEESQVVI
jgi:hypothetical protein